MSSIFILKRRCALFVSSNWVRHNSFPPNIGTDFAINIHETLTFPEATVLGHSGSATMEVVLFVDAAGLSAARAL